MHFYSHDIDNSQTYLQSNEWEINFRIQSIFKLPCFSNFLIKNDRSDIYGARLNMQMSHQLWENLFVVWVQSWRCSSARLIWLHCERNCVIAIHSFVGRSRRVYCCSHETNGEARLCLLHSFTVAWWWIFLSSFYYLLLIYCCLATK